MGEGSESVCECVKGKKKGGGGGNQEENNTYKKDMMRKRLTQQMGHASGGIKGRISDWVDRRDRPTEEKEGLVDLRRGRRGWKQDPFTFTPREHY